MGQVIRSSEAEADLLEIWQYVAEDNIESADRLLSAINDKAQALLKRPEIGRKRDELAPALRSLPLGNYVIFYRVSDRNIEIVRVIHGAREIQNIFGELN